MTAFQPAALARCYGRTAQPWPHGAPVTHTRNAHLLCGKHLIPQRNLVSWQPCIPPYRISPTMSRPVNRTVPASDRRSPAARAAGVSSLIRLCPLCPVCHGSSYPALGWGGAATRRGRPGERMVVPAAVRAARAVAWLM